jgi:hypothetical protein
MFQLLKKKLIGQEWQAFKTDIQKKNTMHTHLFVKQPQRCNGQRIHFSLGRTWARFQVPGLVKPRAKTMIFISSIIGVVSGSCHGVRIV